MKFSNHHIVVSSSSMGSTKIAILSYFFCVFVCIDWKVCFRQR